MGNRITVRARSRRTRGGSDPDNMFADFLDEYKNFMNDLNQLSESDRAKVQERFNQIHEDFGDELFESKEDAELAWLALEFQEKESAVKVIYSGNDEILSSS